MPAGHDQLFKELFQHFFTEFMALFYPQVATRLDFVAVTFLDKDLFTATPAGIVSDRIGRRKVLVVGLTVLVAADLSLAFAPGIVGLFAGVALWGGYLGLSQGLLSALVADTAPEDLRGTAFGIFNVLTGLALLAASSLAGVLWTHFGSTVTFATGAGFAIVAAIAFAVRPDAPAPA